MSFSEKQGEWASADLIAACEFHFKFNSIIAGYSQHQVFNSDETGPCFCMLPHPTLVSFFEKRAYGRKKSKRVFGPLKR